MVKGKQTTAMFSYVKTKETESNDQVFTFVGANTLPDRAAGTSKDGTPVKGEILSKNVLDKIGGFINDESNMGGDFGSFRTVSLFHDRVYSQDFKLEEAGFVIPGSATVQEMSKFPGNYELLVDVEVNKYYVPTQYPDYTPEKISYKIEKGALGISIEYDNEPHQERVVNVDGNKYNYVMDTDKFRGFGFARPNLIGNTRAVRVKEMLIAEELNSADKKLKGEMQMDSTKIKEMESDLAAAQAKIKELEESQKVAEDKAKDAESSDKAAAEKQAEEVKKELADVQEKVKEMKLGLDTTATKIKESIELAFSTAKIGSPVVTNEVGSSKVKEIYASIETKDFAKFKEQSMEFIEANNTKLKEIFSRTGTGFDFEAHQTVEVKVKNRQLVIVPSTKTKDILDSGSMDEGTYNQTNAMFADRYVAGITETFLRDDTLLTAMPKEQHLGGNDKYQWRIWTSYTTVTGDNTLAVNPTITSVARTTRTFEKMESRIVEYRDGVEVTDFTQHHSMAAIGDLLGKQLDRAAQAVTESMNADLFKPKTDNTTGWLGFVGLIGVADSATYTSMYGKTRSAANRLLDGTVGNTYITAAAPISVSVVRLGYEKVLAHGSAINSLVIVAHPTQVRRLFDTEDAGIRHSPLTMNAAPPGFGFSRTMVPHLDGIPIIRDYRCESSAAAADMFAVVDFSADKGFNLIVSRPLGARGLAKVGTSEAAYVNFWGAAIYKSPRNVFVQDSLTAT